MPYVRRKVSMRRDSLVASQDLRRASRGCAEMGLSVSCGEGPTPARRRSCRPGAEGAAREAEGMWLNVEAWASCGTMRSDWIVGGGVSWLDG